MITRTQFRLDVTADSETLNLLDTHAVVARAIESAIGPHHTTKVCRNNVGKWLLITAIE